MPATACCLSCGFVFEFDAAYFRERRLAPPRRCRNCRARRRERVGLHGRVLSAGWRFAILRGDDGREYVLPGRLVPGLKAGDRCTFAAIPGEQPAAGERPVAFEAAPETA
jgi:hypothetical protein